MTLNIGIIGGGQLGKMLIEAILQVDDNNETNIFVLDPQFDCPCAKIPRVNYMQGSLQDEEVLQEFCKICDVVT